MKKFTCTLIVICFSLIAFAKGPGRRYTASLDNTQVVRAQRAQKVALRNFGTGRRYSAITRGRGFHLFGKRNGGASRPESGLGL